MPTADEPWGTGGSFAGGEGQGCQEVPRGTWGERQPGPRFVYPTAGQHQHLCGDLSPHPGDGLDVLPAHTLRHAAPP